MRSVHVSQKPVKAVPFVSHEEIKARERREVSMKLQGRWTARGSRACSWNLRALVFDLVSLITSSTSIKSTEQRRAGGL